MRTRLHTVRLLVICCALLLACAARVLANCGDTQNARDPFETYNPNDPRFCVDFTKTDHWKVYWMDGYERDVDVTDNAKAFTSGIFNTCNKCWPGFSNPSFTEVGNTAYWDQPTTSATVDGNHNCGQDGTVHSHRQGHECRCGGAGCSDEWPNCTPDCSGDPCGGDPCCGDPCCGDACCGDPCCGDACCGDPCCGDPNCGQQCYQVCSQDCWECCTVYDDYGECYFEEWCCDEPDCHIECY